jgi:hypothetical protein
MDCCRQVSLKFRTTGRTDIDPGESDSRISRWLMPPQNKLSLQLRLLIFVHLSDFLLLPRLLTLAFLSPNMNGMNTERAA